MSERHVSTEKKKNPIAQMKSVRLVSKLPVVESTYKYASSVYSKIKNLNRVTSWGLGSVEGGLHLVVEGWLPLVKTPLSVVDNILYRGLEHIELTVPAVTYPPQLLVSMSRDYFSAKVMKPVMKRADSVKQLGLNGASKYGVLAVNRLDNALDIADRYVDRYLPDAADTTDKEDGSEGEENKRVKTIKHVNRLSRKLQRRLTRRTMAEARALKQQSIDTLQCLAYLADLMVRDPVVFAEKMKLVWLKLSEDEPENQMPPRNLEQLVSMLVREVSRRLVHATNFTLRLATNLPALTLNTAQAAAHQAQFAIDYLLKIVHLDGVKAYAVATATSQINQVKLTMVELQKLVIVILDSILSQSAGQEKPKIATSEPTIALPPSDNKRAIDSNNAENEYTQQNNVDQNNTSSNDISSNDKPPQY